MYGDAGSGGTRNDEKRLFAGQTFEHVLAASRPQTDTGSTSSDTRQEQCQCGSDLRIRDALALALYRTPGLVRISTRHIVLSTRRVKSGELNVRTPELRRVPHKARDRDGLALRVLRCDE
jgi:hypothetical protein